MKRDGAAERSRRPWLRIGIRTMFVFVTLFCVGLGCFVQRVRRQAAAIEWAEKNGGQVELEWAGGRPLMSPFFVNAIGKEYFATAVGVRFGNSPRLRDVSGLSGLTELRTLDLSQTQVSDLSPLRDLHSVEHLDIRDTAVCDLSPLASMSRMKYLDISNTNVSDVSSLSSMRNLEYLALYRTSVKQVSAMSGMVRLEHINLCGTRVENISELAQLEALTWLAIDKRSLGRVDQLSGFKSLRELHIRDGQITDRERARIMERLPNCTIVCFKH